MPWNKDRITALLLEAGDMALQLRRTISWERKSDRSLVTEADRKIEAFLTGEIEDPGAGIYLIGEETVNEKGEDYLSAALQREAFVIDPIDGTSPYAHGMPHWGVSICRMVNGELVDGAVYLPQFQEIVMSDGDAVLQGTLVEGSWRWEELGDAERDLDGARLVAITQGLAKRGRVTLPNSIMVLGAAVVPLIGLLQRRFCGYLGNVKLWDVAGALPLLLKKKFEVSIYPDGDRREVSAVVEDRIYDLNPGSPSRWALKSDLMVCHPDDESRFRDAFRYVG